jgi:SAM-dependent methyltransferase
MRPIELRGEKYLQVSYFDATKDITKNFRIAETGPGLNEVLDAGFARIHIARGSEELDIQTTKKGKVLVGRGNVRSASPEPIQSHNRIKDVPLPEGRADHFLEALGVLTRDGRVRPSMRAKYTQINELLKQLRHVLDETGLRSVGRPVEILDCGCGTSFLTLAVHHYLKDVLGIPANIVGVDVNEEVIRKSVERSRRVGADRLTFSCGPIGAVAASPDIVIALHACDTATDDAIAHAIVHEARLLLSVPCCHHNLNDALRAEGAARALRPLLRHGILQQRTADMVTDAFRALVLRIMGYRTDVIEFIGTEHTARNLMIRAVRGAPIGEAAFVAEYLEMRSFWGLTPYIEGVLGEALQRVLAAR